MQDGQMQSSRASKIVAWISLFVIAGFYIISSLGWFLATYMTATGTLGREAAEFVRSLTPLDHIVRVSQVLLIVVASLLLLFCKRTARIPLLICLLISGLATAFVGKWGITFLGGLIGFLILALVTAYAWWLSERKLLH